MITQCKKLTNSRKKLGQTTIKARKGLPRIAHHFHKPNIQDLAINKSTRERTSQRERKFQTNYFSQEEELCLNEIL
jgi:hypothetical protein